MMRTFLLIPLVFLFVAASAQKGVYYSMEDALRHPDAVRTLVINMNNLPMNRPPVASASLEGIGQLSQLEELIIFPFEEMIYGIGEIRAVSDPKDCVFESTLDVEVLPLELPAEIARCRKLRAIHLSGLELLGSPQPLLELPGLQVLEIGPTGIDPEILTAVLIGLTQLRTLQVWTSRLDRSQIERVRLAHPTVNVLATMEDVGSIVRSRDTFYSAVVGMRRARLTFSEPRMAHLFIDSLRPKIVSKYQIVYEESPRRHQELPLK